MKISPPLAPLCLGIALLASIPSAAVRAREATDVDPSRERASASAERAAASNGLAATSDARAAVATEPAASRPRIGLALSGGGARGIAHIGVLKVLEEMRVPIDCVTGTSMGAVVGGTFAAGNSPSRLESLALGADWSAIFRDRPPRQEISTRRKEEDFKTLFAPEFGVKGGTLALPKGLIAGVSIEAFFRVLGEPAIGVSDFRALPVPFEAMATDIETGESVVLDRGSLPKAMRASMAIPGAISPVEIDGRLLVDGGIANNLPIDEARNLCADVVIAVNIGTPPLQRKDLTSALSMVEQLVNLMGKQTVDQQLKAMRSGDVLIEPQLGDITAATFERAKDAIAIGEAATRSRASALSRYSLPPEQYAALRARQQALRVEIGAVDEIRFEGLERTNAEVLRGLLRIRPGEPLTEEAIGTDLRRIYGRGDFEGIDYRIEGEHPRALVITPREKSWGPDYFRFGLGLESDFRGDSEFNVLAQYRRTWINRLGGEWLTELQIGQDTHLSSELYQPLHERGDWFASLYGRIGQTTRGVFVGDDKVADYRVGTGTVGLDLGRALGTVGTVRAGLVWNRTNARVETGDPVLPSVREDTAGPHLTMVVDQLDHPWFPQDGYIGRLSYFAGTKALGSARDYQRLSVGGQAAKSWGPHTVSVTASGGTDFGTGMPAYESFTLGGPLRLSGFRVNQFAGREYAFLRAMYYRRLIELPDILGSGVYGGFSAEAGTIRDRADGLPSPGTHYSGSVFLGAVTFAGPAYLGFGIGDGGAYSLYLLVGAP